MSISVAFLTFFQGLASALTKAVQDRLKEAARILMVETSSALEQEAARALYPKLGFQEEARVREYYAPNEDKIIFTMRL